MLGAAQNCKTDILLGGLTLRREILVGARSLMELVLRARDQPLVGSVGHGSTLSQPYGRGNPASE